MRPHKTKMLTACAVCILLCFANYAYGGELKEEANVKQESQEQGPEPIVLEEPVVPVEENTNNSKGERSVELMPKKPPQPEGEPWDALVTSQSAEESLETKEEDAVSNEEELWAWLEGHSATGGTVFLGDKVSITQHNKLYGISGEIIINTGSNGLVFNGGTFPSGDIKIMGEGVKMPVVDVWQVGDGSAYNSSWDSSLLQMNITATGQEEKGGTALRISAADAVSFDITNLSWQGEICSYGEGARGLWLAVPMEAWCYNVKVSGSNSMAVYAPNGANLYYCKLTAEGEGAVAAAGKDVSFDSCVAMPASTDVKNINRRAMTESFSRLYLPLKQNQYHISAIDMLYTPNVFLASQDGSIITRVFAIDWDFDTYDRIDTSVLGKTIITGRVDSALYGLGVFDNVPITLSVEVRAPELPCISQISVKEKDGMRFAVLNFWQGYDPTEEDVILWRSDDEGATWQDATRANDIFWDTAFGDSVKFTYDTLEHPVWFQLEIVSIGESNIAILDEKDGVFIGGNGGDRTGTDRGGVKLPDVGDEDGSGQGGNTPKDEGGSNHGGEGSQPNEGKDDLTKENEVPNKEEQPDNTDALIFEPDAGLSVSVDGVESDNLIEDDSEEYAEALIPSDKPPLYIGKEDLPVWKSTTVFAQSPALGEKPKVEVTSPAKSKTEGEILHGKKEEPPAIAENGTIGTEEQSSPKPVFSSKRLTIFFLCAAGVCFAGLLIFGFNRRGR